MRTITIVGHRTNRFGGWNNESPECLAIRSFIDTLVMALKVKYDDGLKIISGGALGVDQWAMESAIFLKVPVTVAIPFKNYHKAWPNESQRRFSYLCGLADKIHFVSEVSKFKPVLLYKRNLWMLEMSDFAVFVYDGGKGGTAGAVQEAAKMKLPMIIIDPAKVISGNYESCLRYIDGKDDSINHEIRAIRLFKEKDKDV